MTADSFSSLYNSSGHSQENLERGEGGIGVMKWSLAGGCGDLSCWAALTAVFPQCRATCSFPPPGRREFVTWGWEVDWQNCSSGSQTQLSSWSHDSRCRSCLSSCHLTSNTIALRPDWLVPHTCCKCCALIGRSGVTCIVMWKSGLMVLQPQLDFVCSDCLSGVGTLNCRKLRQIVRNPGRFATQTVSIDEQPEGLILLFHARPGLLTLVLFVLLSPHK